MQETHVQSLSRDDPLEKRMATHSVFLPGESCGWRSLACCSPWGLKDSEWATEAHRSGDSSILLANLWDLITAEVSVGSVTWWSHASFLKRKVVWDTLHFSTLNYYKISECLLERFKRGPNLSFNSAATSLWIRESWLILKINLSQETKFQDW